MKIDRETGLTEQQKHAIHLIVRGKSISRTAEELGIDRTTIYKWSKKENFIAYRNSLREELQNELADRVLSLYDESLSVITNGLKSESESNRLRTAFWIIDKISKQVIGSTDPIKLIKSKAQKSEILHDMLDLDTEKFRFLLTENNLNQLNEENSY